MKSGTALVAAFTLTCTLTGAWSRPLAAAAPSPDSGPSSAAAAATARDSSADAPPTTASSALTPPPRPSSTQAPPRAQRARPAMALTGCLKNSDDPQVFLLTSAHRADADPASEADEPSSTGGAGAGSKASASASAGEGRTYRIVPLSPKVDVKSHVGERVEVGGRLLQEKIRGEESPDTAASGARASGSGGKSPQTTIAVAYVRKLADTCTASQP